MTDDKIIICENQQEFFEYAAKQMINMYKFIPDFLQSDFCNRELDSTYSVFQYSDVLDWKDFLQKEISFSPDILTDNKIPSKMAGWIGYTYRYIQIETGLKSKKIIERIPLDNIVNYYAGLHTVDEIMAYEIISHDFKII